MVPQSRGHAARQLRMEIGMSVELTTGPDLRQVLTTMLCRSVSSDNSRAAYTNALRRFFAWLDNPEYTGPPRKLTRATVLEYRETMESENLAPSTVGLRLTAIRQLTREARIAGLIDHDTAESITMIKGPAGRNRRTGNWLNARQAADLILTPPADTLRGKRDRAILATLVGCGLRRNELARLCDSDIGQRDGRWCIVDLAGKGKRMRTVPMPAFAKALIDDWIAARDRVWKWQAFDGQAPSPRLFVAMNNRVPSGATTEFYRWPSPRLFVAMNNRGLLGLSMSSNAIYDTVLHWAKAARLPIAPHDLRRTFSRLALAGRADLHQIQLSLGHSSIQTTERYLGTQQDLENAPCDVLGIELGL